MTVPTRNLVSGGCGFLASHLIDRLIASGQFVYCVDDLSSGSISNIQHLLDSPFFSFVQHDVVDPITLDVDVIWHFACPASAISYQANPIKTAETCFLGTSNLLSLATSLKARFLLASTSEVYGDPDVHPQPETYLGSVSTTGIRACYDEGKRIAETLCFDYHRTFGTDVRVARIFNTYGPRLLPDDGRVISNFIVQALRGHPLTIYGDGSQSRSFCYVNDLIDGVVSLMDSNFSLPINLGNPAEITIIQLADYIRSRINPCLSLVHQPQPPDDPRMRQPDISLAQRTLGWQPQITLEEGLDSTIEWFKAALD